MSWYYYICDFIFNFCEIKLIFCLMGAGLTLRWKKSAMKVIQWILTGMIAFHNTANVIVKQLVFSSNVMIVEICLTALAGYFLYRGKKTAHVTVCALFFMGIELLELSIQFFIWNLLSGTEIPENLLLKIGIERGCYLLVAAEGIYLFEKKLKIKCKQIIFWIRKYRMFLRLVVPVLFLLIVYYQQLYFYKGISEISMGNWLLLIFIVYILIFLIATYPLKENERILQLKYQMMLENYKKSQEQYKLKAELLHDEKHHLLLIREMARRKEVNEIGEYIDQVIRKIGESGNQVETGNQFLNLILNAKVYEAELNGITVDVYFDSMEDLILEESELSILFCNALDNSIEANLRLMEGQKRKISIRGKRIGHAMIVNISNPACEMPIKNGDRLLTTKDDKKIHGYGVDSMKRVAECYQGYVQYRVENQVFVLTIYLMGFK